MLKEGQSRRSDHARRHTRGHPNKHVQKCCQLAGTSPSGREEGPKLKMVNSKVRVCRGTRAQENYEKLSRRRKERLDPDTQHQPEDNPPPSKGTPKGTPQTQENHQTDPWPGNPPTRRTSVKGSTRKNQRRNRQGPKGGTPRRTDAVGRHPRRV